MILVADAGGTKCHWAVVGGSTCGIISTSGINPVTMSTSQTSAVLRDELLPQLYDTQISEIYSIDEKMGSFYFDVSIDGFKKTFGVKDISRNIKMLDSGAVMLTDADGNRFIIPDINALKPRTRRKIEPFLY